MGLTDKNERNTKMSAPNFKTMDDFPLIVADDQYAKFCPECGCSNADDAEKCECCDADLTEVERTYDEILNQETCREMEKVAERLNEAQRFFNVTVESGYYCGVQFYVEEKVDGTETLDNEEANWEFGMCRSLMLRKYRTAGNLIRRELKKAKEELGLMELGLTAMFSNGEAIYTKVA